MNTYIQHKRKHLHTHTHTKMHTCTHKQNKQEPAGVTSAEAEVGDAVMPISAGIAQG